MNAGTNVLAVDINSDWKYRDAKCKFVNGANICSIRTLNIDRTLSYYLPAPASNNDDTLVCQNTAQILTNKSIDAASNTMTGFVQLPSARKWGALMIGNDPAERGLGLLYGISHAPTAPVFQVGTTNGLNWRYNSGGSANTVTGLRFPNTAGTQFACRSFHSAIRAKTRVITGPAATRQYIGFSTRIQLPGSDSPIANEESAALIGWRTSDAGTAVQVFRNAGTAAAPTTMSVTSTAIAPTTGVTQFEISFVEANPDTGNPAVRARILSSRGSTQVWQQYFENNIPALDTMMMPTCIYSTTGTNTNYDVYFVQVEQDQ